MKESLKQNQAENERKVKERADLNLALLQKPVANLTAYDVDQMPADIYKQRLADPAFVEFVNK